jgi:hypothetical protein
MCAWLSRLSRLLSFFTLPWKAGRSHMLQHPRSSFRPSGPLGPREPEPSKHRPMLWPHDRAEFAHSVVTGPRLGASPANSAFTRVGDALWPGSLGRGDIPYSIALPWKGRVGSRPDGRAGGGVKRRGKCRMLGSTGRHRRHDKT